MKGNIRCEACGRRRKSAHEKRCGTKKAYDEGCVTYGDWKKGQEQKRKT